ncbi:OmpA family protein [Reinekea blandensis]|uniref:Outer membrane protein and related peptidoglycan-associated (Lipo)protein n=1 Tax=Reinekea blandensis MED297 TaxID=314283 RepID=A4BDA9_9GAMM|nr:OmpA family protein [Reinekea blandensis]EAR09853.1 Outer membrane protein and related peptidoglycan-associated (lipo)protein [Reinekea sp. MED297] [Reinekea blandensis MED297]
MQNWAKIGLPLALTGAVLSGCTTLEAYTGETQISGASKGAIAGGLIGAVIGAATAPKEERAKRAIIGAGIGGVAGGGVGYYMDQQEKELRDELVGTGVQVKRTEEGQIDLIMPGNITFDVNSSTVADGFIPTLRSVAKVLKEYENTLVTISGHTDSSGSEDYNQLLSEQRATSVANIILQEGIVVERVAAAGYGELQPIASNDTPEGRAENRRVEITLDAIVAE